MTGTVYLRDQGVICYEARLDVNQQQLDELPKLLLSTGLKWYWASERTAPVDEASVALNLPEKRPFTLLTPSNSRLLIEDFLERDVDWYGRFISIIGVDSDADFQPLNETHLKTALEEFACRETGPIRIVVSQINDSADSYVFMPHDPITQVKELLEEFGVNPSTIRKTRPYRRLYTVRLEAIFGLGPC